MQVEHLVDKRDLRTITTLVETARKFIVHIIILYNHDEQKCISLGSTGSAKNFTFYYTEEFYSFRILYFSSFQSVLIIAPDSCS